MIKDWIKTTSALLKELNEADFGENKIHPPSSPETIKRLKSMDISRRMPDDLLSFYQEANGLDWPGIHKGYSLYDSGNMLGMSSAFNEELGPPEKTPIFIFGCREKGHLFAMNNINKQILYLPPETIKGIPHYGGRCTVVAQSFPDFLERLQMDLKNFINKTPNAVYLGE